MNRNCTLWTLRVAWLKALSLLRFFVALDKEMTRRHACDKEISEPKQTTNTESSNPAMTQTASAGTS
jgi:hypothetical protein